MLTQPPVAGLSGHYQIVQSTVLYCTVLYCAILASNAWSLSPLIINHILNINIFIVHFDERRKNSLHCEHLFFPSSFWHINFLCCVHCAMRSTTHTSSLCGRLATTGPVLDRSRHIPSMCTTTGGGHYATLVRSGGPQHLVMGDDIDVICLYWN